MLPAEKCACGREVVIRCEDVIKDEDSNIVELRCTYDPETLGVLLPTSKSAGSSTGFQRPMRCPVKVRLYDRLFTIENPEK